MSGDTKENFLNYVSVTLNIQTSREKVWRSLIPSHYHFGRHMKVMLVGVASIVFTQPVFAWVYAHAIS